MCIRDRVNPLDLDLILPKEAYFRGILPDVQDFVITGHYAICLLYTSDAADERSSVDLGGRRILKKKKTLLDDNLTNFWTSN